MKPFAHGFCGDFFYNPRGDPLIVPPESITLEIDENQARTKKISSLFTSEIQILYIEELESLQTLLAPEHLKSRV